MKFLLHCFKFFFYICFAEVSAIFGQNLVVNGNFDIYLRCPQTYNHYRSNIRELLPGWTTVNASTPDFFHRCSKNSDVGIPVNFAGNIEPVEGNGYIGLILRADKQTYPYSPSYSEHITGTLEKPLEKGKIYCFSMMYAFAQNSGISTNSIGVYFSEIKPQFKENDDYYSFQPQLQLHSDSTLKTDYDWHLLSATYVADGGEKYLTIGNFLPVAKSKNLPHTPVVTNDTRFFAYYYIDNVMLTADIRPQCVEKTAFIVLKDSSVIAIDTSEAESKFEPGQIYTLKHLHFDFEKSQIRPESYDELNQLIVFLKEHPNINIRIIGHTDNRGNDAYNKILSEARAKAVFEYLYNGGIPVHRMTYIGMGSRMSVADNDTEYGRQQNRRVEIEFYISDFKQKKND